MTDQPLISVIIPVYGVRRYLAECLDSVLGAADGTPVEVIAVDDASPDGCGALLDERSRADSRLCVIHLDRTEGPGNARNAGLAKAAGEYAWFVDGDDLLPPGALAAVAGRLAAARPDALLIDYEDLYPDGTTGPSPGAAVLRAAPAGLFTLDQAPEMINLTMTGWSKLFRRDFLTALHQPFRPGIHEDIPVTCAALFAGRLGALAQPCYRYRRSRPGSFMATSGTAHFAIFDAYHEVLAALADLTAAGAPVATPAVQAAVFERAITHYAAVLQSTGPGIGPIGRPGLVPRRDRRKFFTQMHADFTAHAPPGYQVPPGPRGAKLRLIQRNAYWTYELLEPLNRLRVALQRSSRRSS